MSCLIMRSTVSNRRLGRLWPYFLIILAVLSSTKMPFQIQKTYVEKPWIEKMIKQLQEPAPEARCEVSPVRKHWVESREE